MTPKNRFTTEPVSKGRIFEVSYGSIKPKKDSAGLRSFLTIDHYNIGLIAKQDKSEFSKRLVI